MRSLFIVVVMLAALALSVSSAFAGDGKPMLRRGIELYREASYAESVAMLEHARARGGLEPAERVECSFYLAAGYVALSSTGAARRELRAVLHDAPDYELPQYTSPKVATLFREVKEELESAPRLRPLPPERRGDVLALRFEASRTGGPAFGVVQWRWHGEPAWHEAPLHHDGHDGALLRADVSLERAGALEYYAEGRTTNGALAAGTASEPLELPVVGDPKLTLVAAGPPPPSRARRLWWLWTGLGAIGAAGLGVGLYFALRPQPATANAVFDFQVH